MNKQYTEAAQSLVKNRAYILLRNTMIDQLAEPSDILLDKPDYVVARAHNHDMGIRNFFRWVSKTAEGAASAELASTLRPFEHYEPTPK